MLSRVPYVAIATICLDGQPWNTPVVGRFDKDLSLYWVSSRASQHSQNIIREPRIFVVAYDSQAPEGTATGLYLQMEARVLNESKEIQLAQKIYDTSFFGQEDSKLSSFQGSSPLRLYKAKPIKVWQNTEHDINGYMVDARQEIIEQPQA